MIHICFALSDPTGGYSKYLGVAMCSLLENTHENLNIHLIHDDTLSENNKRNFYKLVDTYKQKLNLYQIDSNIFMNKVAMHGFNIGTLFRFKLTDILPLNIERIIYLDADLIVHLDINELWTLDLDNNLVAARRDAAGPRTPCEKGLVEADEYFNAGVMIYDVKNIRKYCNLLENSMKYLYENPDSTLLDQDALNVLFRGKVKYISSKFNIFTYFERQKSLISENLGIYHFAGDHVNFKRPVFFDTLFLFYLSKTPWGERKTVYEILHPIVKQLSTELKSYYNLVRKIANQKNKLIIFGAGSNLRKLLDDVVTLNVNRDYYVDNNPALQGTSINGIKVYSPEMIVTESMGDFIVIVLSKKYYSDIKKQLMTYKLCENEDFFDGRLFLEGR